MSDFNDQLRQYIDGLAEPVTMQETTSPKMRPVRDYPVPAAILAGAAVVLIPTLVLLGIRLWPASDPVVNPTAVPPAITTTASPTTTSTTTTVPPTTPAPRLLVPDVVGLSVADALAAVEDVGLELEIVSTFPDRLRVGVVAQDPAPGADAGRGATVLVDVAVYPTCHQGPLTEPLPGDNEILVTVLFECANTGSVPGDWVPVTRVQPADTSPIGGTLRGLLAGPTEEEQLAGFGSFFSVESAGALQEVNLDPDGRLAVDFNDAILIGNATTSTGSLFFLAELEANLYQYSEVDSIEFRLNDSCEAFYNWLQGSCQISTRAEWRRRLEAWDDERELQPAPGERLGINDLVDRTFSTALGGTDERIFTLDGGRITDSGFSKTAQWLVDDPPAEEESSPTWMLRVLGLNEDMIWLVDSGTPAEDGQLIFRVRATMRIPWDEILSQMQSDPVLLSGADTCTLDGSSEPRLTVAAEMLVGDDDGVTGATRPLRAWLVDVGEAAFNEISTDGVECFIALG